jgi:hypothetical protein
VELVAARRPLRRRGADGAYRALHRRLLACCRSLAKEAPDREERRFYESLEELARPWLSLPVLAQTERKIVADLLHCCHQADRRLNGRNWFPRLPRWLLLPAASLAAAAAFLCVPGLGRVWAPLANWLLGLVHTLAVLYGGTSAGQRLLAAGIALILTAILAVLHARLS